MTSVEQIQRFNQRYIPVTESGCWLWTYGCTNDGYGALYVDGKQTYAHRFSYELHRGHIPAGLTIDHLCRVRCCVNPEHLEVVTNKENVLRGESPLANNARKTHCNNGHLFSEDNIYRTRLGKNCRLCTIHLMKLYRARNKQLAS